MKRYKLHTAAGTNSKELEPLLTGENKGQYDVNLRDRYDDKPSPCYVAGPLASFSSPCSSFFSFLFLFFLPFCFSSAQVSFSLLLPLETAARLCTMLCTTTKPSKSILETRFLPFSFFFFLFFKKKNKKTQKHFFPQVRQASHRSRS